MDVGDVVRILCGMKADLVGRSMSDTTFKPAAGHPDREPVRMVIATIGSLRAGCAAKLSRKDNDGLFQQSSPFQVLQKASDWAIDLAGKLCVTGLQIRMRIPRSGGAGSVHDLNESNASFCEPSRRK